MGPMGNCSLTGALHLLPMEEERPRPIIGCARRSPAEELKDAGSIPATSTHGCCRIGTPSDLETPQGSCPAGFLAVAGLAFGVASAVLRSYPPPCSAPPRCGRVEAGRHRRPATASGWGCQSGGLAVPSTVGLTGSTTSAQCSAAFGRLPNPAQRSRSAHTARRASGS